MGRQSKPYEALGGWRFTYKGKKYWRRTRAEAWAELARLQASDEKAAGRTPQTIASLVERWELDGHGNSHASAMLDEFVEWAGSLPLRHIERETLIKYKKYVSSRKNKKNGKRLSLETIRKKVLHASSVMRWGVKQGWVKILPDVPRLPKPPPTPKAISAERLADFLAELDSSPKLRHAAPLIRFILETGCRPSEARLLEWEEIDLAHRVVVLPDHKTAKRTSESRIIPLSDTAVKIIESMPRRHKRFVFVNRLGKPYTRYGFAAILQRRGLSQYRLRHSWCQAASDAGIPEEIIRKIMGHTTSAMVKMYCRISDERVRHAVSSLDGLSQIQHLGERTVNYTGSHRVLVALWFST